MRTHFVLSIPMLLLACSSNEKSAATNPIDASKGDATSSEAGAFDGGMTDDASPTEPLEDAAADVTTDGTTPEAGCAASWTVAPSVDPSIGVPDGGGGVLLHASATGTQDYTCTQATVDGGTTYAWTFVGPEADLSDCAALKIGKHFASDGGAAAPEWITLNDNTYVIGKKLAANTPDGGASAIPWLLLQEVSSGGAGALSRATYIHRVNTTGGLAPSTTCDANIAATTQKVTYTADYYFYGH